MTIPHVSAIAATSLDGYLTDASAPPSDDDDAEPQPEVDAIVMGRCTWDAVCALPQWPYTGIHVVVMTNRPAHPEHREDIEAGPLQPVLEGLYKSGARNVFLDGTRVIRDALADGLVHDLDLTIFPFVLGDGVRLFDLGFPLTKLRVGSIRRGGSGVVHVRYAFDGRGR